MSTTAAEVVITGHVQGVFYRASLRDRAGELGVTGWARNEPDGSVRAHLEGPAEAVDSLVDWCREGPPRAQVDDVRREPADPTGVRTFETG